MPNNAMQSKDKQKCHAHRRDGEPCTNWAVNERGVCRMHGATAGRPVTKPESILKRVLESDQLKARADALIESGTDVHDLQHLAAMLIILGDELAAKRHEDKTAMPLLLQTLEALRKVSESVARIRASKAFTASEKDWIVLALSDFVETLPELERARLHEFIATRLMLKNATPLAIAGATD